MKLEILPFGFSVCKLNTLSCADLSGEYVFAARTDNEASLVCRTPDVPGDASAVERGWRAIRVCGVLDFTETGIIAGISGALGGAGIPVFVVSTYDIDYVFMKEQNMNKAKDILRAGGYEII